jgi:ATP synthase protein I
VSNDNKDQQRKTKEPLNTFAQFSGIGFQMLVTIGLGVFAGVKMDEYYPNQYSAFTIILSLAAIAISLYNVIKQATRFSNKNTKNNDQRDH